MEIQYFDNKVEEFIDALDRDTLAKTYRSFNLLEQFGHRLGMPHVKQVGRGLFELRILGKISVRYLFTFCAPHIIILHACFKKTMKLTAKDLTRAQANLRHLDI